MKICVVAYKFGTPEEIGGHLGVYNYFREELRTLKEKGHRVFVVAPRVSLSKKGTTEFEGINIERTFWGMQWAWWSWPINRIERWLYIKSTQKKVLEICEREKIDAVYVWQARETGWAISQIRYMLDCPAVFRQITTWKWNLDKSDEEFYKNPLIHRLRNLVVVGDIFKWWFKFLRDKKKQQKFIAHIYRDFDEVLFLSDALRNESFELGMDRNKGQVVPLAVDTDVFKSCHPEFISGSHDDETKTIFYAGRLELKKKGLVELVKALKLLTSDIPNVKLVMAGSGPKEDVEKLLKLREGLGLEENIKFLGRVENNLLPEYYAKADVAVVPSNWMEAFGRVVIEAMACGVPVVSSNAGGIGEININEETGLVFEAGNVPALYESLKKILSDDEYRRKLGENARKRVENVYNYNVVTDSLLAILEKKAKELKDTNLTICYFGIYHPYYSRNRILMKGLRAHKVKIIECNVRDRWFIKYFKLWWKHHNIKKKYDIMFVGFPGHPIMPLAWLLARLNGKKIIFDAFVSLHDAEVYDYENHKEGSLMAKKYWFLDWFSTRLADMVFMDTMMHVDYFIDHYGLNPEKIKRVFVGSDIPDFYEEHLKIATTSKDQKLEIKKPEGKFLVHFHGYYIPLQGVQYIVEAAKLLENEKDIVFNVIGRGAQYDMVMNIVKEKNIQNVNFIWEVNYPSLAKYVSIGDVCLGVFGRTPKPLRVIPNKICEAAALGKATISSDVPAMKEVFVDRIDCLFCRKNDSEDLAAKILEIKNNPQLCEEIAKNGKLLYEKYFTPYVIAGEVKEIAMRIMK